MIWAGCQNNQINLNLYLQKSLEIFEKNSADKVWSNKDIKVKVPCSVSDRVKYLSYESNFHSGKKKMYPDKYLSGLHWTSYEFKKFVPKSRLGTYLENFSLNHRVFDN